MLGTQFRGTGPHLGARGRSHGFSQVSVGTWGIFSNYSGDGPSKLVSSYEGHLGNLHVALQDNTDPSHGEAGDQGSLSSCHRDIGIPFGFQEESGNMTF